MTVETDAPPSIAGLTYVRHLGSGGYSDVYLYEQATPRRKVAVKVLRNVGLTETLRRQFTAEANAMAALADHPNVVSVFTADVTDDGRPYLVMSFYPKDNLGVRAAQERFAVSEVLRIGIQIACVLETAHQSQLLHRDVKPANILTDQYGRVGLTDFGIAAQIAAAEDDDEAGVSVPWAPPEILYSTSPASVQSDVYSLAATLWHLLVGRSPFEVGGDGDNSAHALMRRARDSAVPPTGRADVPPSLQRLLAQAMAKDPAARPPSALDFARSLQAIEQELRVPRTDLVVHADESPALRPVADSAVDTNATRMRAPRVVEAQPANVPLVQAPFGAPSSPPDSSGPARGPEPLASSVTPPSSAARPPAAKKRADATIRRAKVVAPEDSEAGEPAATPSTKRGPSSARVAIALVAVVVLALVVGLFVGSGPSKAKGKATTPTTQQPVNPDGIGPPGPPTVTGTRVDAGTLQFSWTYSNRADSDSFRWQYPDGTRGGTTAKPTLTISGPAGAQVCVQVKVVRADGTNAALSWSDPGCAS